MMSTKKKAMRKDHRLDVKDGNSDERFRGNESFMDGRGWESQGQCSDATVEGIKQSNARDGETKAMNGTLQTEIGQIRGS